MKPNIYLLEKLKASAPNFTTEAYQSNMSTGQPAFHLQVPEFEY